jgi:hypothetical protein
MSNASLLYWMMVLVLLSARLIKGDIATKRVRCLKPPFDVTDSAKKVFMDLVIPVKVGIR